MFHKSALAIAAAGIAASVPLVTPLLAADAAATGRSKSVFTETSAASEETFALHNKAADRCLDGNTGHMLWECNGSQVQKWRLADAGQGKSYLVWNNTGGCVKAWNEIWHAKLKDCSEGTKFTVERTNESYRFKNDENGLCLMADSIWGKWGGRTWYASMNNCSSKLALWTKE